MGLTSETERKQILNEFKKFVKLDPKLSDLVVVKLNLPKWLFGGLHPCMLQYIGMSYDWG